MMSRYLLGLLVVFSLQLKAQDGEKVAITAVLDGWHTAAANADYEAYFSKMTSDGAFIGTDAEENWSVKAFKEFSKPYFDQGKAWSFTALKRNIYISEDGKYAWFDELLDTWMELCRGSGVLRKEDGQWKIAHYVLSMTVPNDHANEVIALKKGKETQVKEKIKH